MIAESEPGRSLVIVFSDGADTSSWLSSEAAVGIARKTGVVLYGVSAGAIGRIPYLADLSASTGGRLIEMATTRNLQAVFLQVLDEFRHRYVLAYSPSGVAPTGWHTLQVKVKRGNVAVKSRPGYFARPPAR